MNIYYAYNFISTNCPQNSDKATQIVFSQKSYFYVGVDNYL